MYKKCPKNFVPRLLASLQVFLEAGALPDAWSKCLMQCIPKHTGEVGLGNLRPICLQNTCVKWVTQVIPLQLEDTPLQLTAPKQKGFMRRRRMIDHVWGVRGLWETHKDGGYLMIDFSNAYDSVAHDHMSSYLRFLGLPEPYLCAVYSLMGRMSDASVFTLCPQSNQSPDPAAILGLKTIDLSAVMQPKQQQWLAGTREWLFDQMDEWLADPDGARTLWLVGRGGTGKTMALTEWLERKVQ